MKKIVSIENATVRRDGRAILSDAALSIYKGGHTALVGPNGAGKSTLIDVIARRVYPLALDNYKNEIFGRERWLISELRPMIGLVSPSYDDFCNTTYTALDIVASGLYSSLGFDFHHSIDESTYIRAREELKKLEVLHLQDRMMNTLSTGEKRRVLLARANITRPELLLLDEASNGLDFPARADLRAKISEYAREDKTVVMVTHELSEIIPEVKRVILMKNGKIIADGSKEALLTSEALSELYERRVTVVSSSDGIYNAFC